MSKQHLSPTEQAALSYKVGGFTVQVHEMIERVLIDNPGVAWADQTDRFMTELFEYRVDIENGKMGYHRNPTVRAAMALSASHGDQHWLHSAAPLGAVHWFGVHNDGVDTDCLAAIDLGPLGMIACGLDTDNRFATGLGFISYVRTADIRPYLGWSLDYANSEPLLPEQLVWRPES